MSFIFKILVRKGRADFFNLLVLHLANLTYFTFLLVLAGFVSGTNQLEYFVDLRAFLENLDDSPSLLVSSLSSPRHSNAFWYPAYCLPSIIEHAAFCTLSMSKAFICVSPVCQTTAQYASSLFDVAIN